MMHSIYSLETGGADLTKPPFVPTPDGEQHVDGILRKQAQAWMHQVLKSPWHPDAQEGVFLEEGRGQSWLTMRSEVTGAFGGSWCIAECKALCALLKAVPHHKGCLGLPWGAWFGEGDGCTDRGPTAVVSRESALKEVLFADLGNGLPVQGLWALVLLGKWNAYESLPKEVKNGIDVTNLHQEAELFGVANWEAFAIAAQVSAVEATEWIMRRVGLSAPRKAGQSLSTVWAQAIRRHPAWMDDRPDLVARLLRALSAKQAICWDDITCWDCTAQSGWVELLKELWDHDRWGALWREPIGNHCAADLEVSIEQHLGLHCPDDIEKICEWLRLGKAAPDIIERLHVWLDTTGASALRLKAKRRTYLIKAKDLNRLKEVLLGYGLPCGGGASPVQKARL